MVRRRLLTALGALGVSQLHASIAKAAVWGGDDSMNDVSKAVAATVRVPLEMDPGGHIFIKAQLLGRTVDALVDSGARRTAIDQGFAQTLGLTPRLSTKAAGMTADVTSERVSLSAVMVGGRQISLGDVLAIDLGGISATLGRSVVLVLGQDCFTGAALTLDFETMTMELGPSRGSPGPGFALSRLRLSPHGRLYTTVSIEGRPPVEALYDLGSNVPVYVSPGYAAQAGLMRNRLTSKAASFGAEGLSVDDVATLSAIVVADQELARVPVQVPVGWNQAAPVVIGAPIWRRFVNVLDLDHAVLWLKPNPLGFHLPFMKDRSGLGAQRLPDRLRILFIAPGSPAELAGLHVGDEITAVDGAPVGPELYQKRPRPGAEPAGTVLRLALASGDSATLTLADYF